MTPLPFKFPFAIPFWFVMIWAFYPEARIIKKASKSVKSGNSSDSGSLKAILIGMQIVQVTAFVICWTAFGRFPGWSQVILFWSGILVLIMGSLLRRHCWRMLGESFTGDVQAREGQVIVTSGAYRFLRHPSYSAGFLMYAGMGLALGSWASTGLLLAGSLLIYTYRMNVEEKTLLNIIGEPYREFMRTRKRVIPFVY